MFFGCFPKLGTIKTALVVCFGGVVVLFRPVFMPFVMQILQWLFLADEGVSHVGCFKFLSFVIYKCLSDCIKMALHLHLDA